MTDSKRRSNGWTLGIVSDGDVHADAELAMGAV